MFDCHVHAGPDVEARARDDLATARSYADAGFTGFVLKAHFESTVGRAAALAAATGLTVYGGVALNRHVAGLNPAAVAATLAAGGRVVWMPTQDSRAHARSGLPRWDAGVADAEGHGYAVPPEEQAAGPVVRAVLEVVAAHDAVLATGHLSVAECRWLVPAAREAGVRRVLLTHPGFTVPAATPAEVAELAGLGAYAEVTAFQLLHQRGITPAALAEVARAAGEGLVLSSDVGQPGSPAPAEALDRLQQTLAAEGLDPGRLRAAAGEVPQRLFAPG